MPDHFSTRALRVLLLPIGSATSDESKGAALLKNRLAAVDVHGEDCVNWVQLQLNSWEDAREPSHQLRTIVQEILVAGGGSHGQRIAECYFTAHSKLMRDRLFTHEEARWLLNHTPLILSLAESEKFSAAQIARIVGRMDERAKFSRQSVEIILNALGAMRRISSDDVAQLIASDAAAEGATFADSSLQDAAELVGLTAVTLGYNSDLAGALNVLAGSDELSTQVPYLQMLHYQCSIAEYFDHALTDLYEFRPRGTAATTIFAIFGRLASAGNPFLNNAKSVEQIGPAWVRSKKRNELPSAAALYDVLINLELLGFSARREIARLIRLWIHRLVRLRLGERLPDIPALDANQWQALLAFAIEGNTGTYGILEQRIVDAIASETHRREDGWRARGLGSSVNATNLSERKLGDCDFQSVDSAQIYAYESHGGKLSDVYVAEHLRTLRKVAVHRASELRAILELDHWDVRVCFVAHAIGTSREIVDPVVIGGIRFTLEMREFSSFIEPMSEMTPENVALLNELVLQPINASNTPESVRQRIREALRL